MSFAMLPRRGAQYAPGQRKIIRDVRTMFAPTVQPVQMNLQMVCRGRTSGHLLLRICRNSPWHTLRKRLCTPKNIPGVDHSWSIFITIRGIDKNANRATALSFRINRAYSHARRFFSPGKRDFSSGKRHFSSRKYTEQRRAEDRTEEQSIAENSRA